VVFVVVVVVIVVIFIVGCCCCFSEQMNTYQAVLATDGTSSYAIFTYRCGDINWARSSSIGYNAPGGIFLNHPLAGGPGAANIDCSGSQTWTNLLYNLTGSSANIATPSPIEPRESGILLAV